MSGRALVILTDGPDDDAIAAAKELLDSGSWTRTPLGWIVTAHGDVDPRRAAANARQRRYRATRKGDARDARVSDARDAVENPNSDVDSGGNYSLPTPFGGREGVSKPPAGDASDASPCDARDASRRDAMTRHPSDATEPRRVELPGPEAWRIEPLTDAERDVGRRRSAEYADKLRKGEL